ALLFPGGAGCAPREVAGCQPARALGVGAAAGPGGAARRDGRARRGGGDPATGISAAGERAPDHPPSPRRDQPVLQANRRTAGVSRRSSAITLLSSPPVIGCRVSEGYAETAIGSASTKWALLSPIFVPMLMQACRRSLRRLSTSSA